MPELILTLPDDLYAQLRAEAARKGLSVEGFIVDRLAAETAVAEQQEKGRCLLDKALSSSGLLQSVDEALSAAYVSDSAAPRQSPIHVSGKPLSTVIIEQRAGLR
jgi:plasmid stability protein